MNFNGIAKVRDIATVGVRRNPASRAELERGIHAILEADNGLNHHEIRNKLRREMGYGFGNDEFNDAVRAVKSIMGLPYRARKKRETAAAEATPAPTPPITPEPSKADFEAWLDMGRELFGAIKFEVRLLP
jgi:hypothetical protein